MSKTCPNCGNQKDFSPTMLEDEYTCEKCETLFSESKQEALSIPNYRLFCENVTKSIRENLTDASLSSTIGTLQEGYLNEGIDSSKDFIEKLTEIAQDVYSDHMRGFREKADFITVMEGIEQFVEFYERQFPEDDTFEDKQVDIPSPSEVVPEVGGDMPGMDNTASEMLTPQDPPIEQEEHANLDDLKNTISHLQSIVAKLEDVEGREQELGSDEGDQHEQDEETFLADIKDCIGKLQSTMDQYLNSEKNAHFNAPTIRNQVSDVYDTLTNGSQYNGSLREGSFDFTLREKLKSICEEVNQMIQDCGISEDAQLVSQDHIDGQLQDAIDTNTQEISEDDAAMLSGETMDLPGEVSDFEQPHPLEGKNVIYDTQEWFVQSIQGEVANLESTTGETMQAPVSELSLARTEDSDTLFEDFERGTYSLKKAWESIQEGIEKSDNLMAPVRRFDLRENLMASVNKSVSQKAAQTNDPRNMERQSFNAAKMGVPKNKLEQGPTKLQKGGRDFVRVADHLGVQYDTYNSLKENDKFMLLSKSADKPYKTLLDGKSSDEVVKYLQSKIEIPNDKLEQFKGLLSAQQSDEQQGQAQMNMKAVAETLENSNIQLEEGQYLSRNEEVPIPFTQDPTLKAGKEDILKDSEILKGGEVMEQEENDETATGKKNPKGSVNKKAAFGGTGGAEDGTIAESYSGFKVGDTVCLNNIKNREWIVESIQRIDEENSKYGLRNGLRKMVVRTGEMIMEHIEGVEIHRERFQDSISGLTKIYENMEMNGLTDIEEEIPEEGPSAVNTRPTLEKYNLYKHIKENGLTDIDKTTALQKIMEVCSNEIEEVYSVYEDACLSKRNCNIDETYNYVGDDEFNQNNSGLMTNLNDAYASIQQKELEETAKKFAEEGDRSGSKGGLGAGPDPFMAPVSIG